jgi:hypothetical protein
MTTNDHIGRFGQITPGRQIAELANVLVRLVCCAARGQLRWEKSTPAPLLAGTDFWYIGTGLVFRAILPRPTPLGERHPVRFAG